MHEEKKAVSESEVKPWKALQSDVKLESIKDIPFFVPIQRSVLDAKIFAFYMDTKAFFDKNYWEKKENGGLRSDFSIGVWEVVNKIAGILPPNANKLIPIFIMHLLHFPGLGALIHSCNQGMCRDSARIFLKTTIRLLFERAESLITREQQLFEEQSQNAQYIQNVQAHLDRAKTERDKWEQPLILLSQQLQQEEKQYKAASSCLIEVKAVINNNNLDIQSKMSQIAELLSLVEQKPEAKIPEPLSLDNPAIIEQQAIPVPASFLFIVNAALYVEKDQIKHMIFMMSALTPISVEAKRAHEQVRNKTFFSWRGCGWTAEKDRSEISREFSAFGQAMISLTPTQEPMILKANQCLRALMRAILKAPDLGDLHLYHFPFLQSFIRCVTENLFERLESLCDNVGRLERIKKEDADKMQQLDRACIKLHFSGWAPQKKRKQLESNIAATQEAAVRPKKYLKQLTSIFRVREFTSENKTIQAMSNLVKEYFAPKN